MMSSERQRRKQLLSILLACTALSISLASTKPQPTNNAKQNFHLRKNNSNNNNNNNDHSTNRRAAIAIEERTILTSLYQNTGGASWKDSTNWLSHPDICQWYGITCTEFDTQDLSVKLPKPAVYKIELGANNLIGSIPLSLLWRLPYLTVLKIDRNDVTYDDYVEQELDVLGEQFDSEADISTNVRFVDLSYTDIGSSANPSSAGMGSFAPIFETGGGASVHFPQLTDLYLTSTNLRGIIPYTLPPLLSSIERLTFDANALRGTIPPEIGNLLGLRYLSFYENELTGEIPDTLGQLSKLRHLILRDNHLTGVIPASITLGSNLPLLQQLDLSRQVDSTGSISTVKKGTKGGLTGDLPSFATLTNLVQLDLRYNKLGGSVPPDFLEGVNPLTFEYAFLSSNDLTGVLTYDAVGHLPADSIFLEDNQISELEESVCSETRGGVIAAFGCRGVLCPPGTYGPAIGRQESESNPCETCTSAQYWGATNCLGGNTGIGVGLTSSPTKAPTQEPTAVVKLTEREILLKFFDETGGPNWVHNDGWTNGGSNSFCDWYGIGCLAEGDDDGNDTVEYILLNANNLVGRPPPELFQLKNLRTLVLARNTISFSFDGIIEAASLNSLDLSSTGLHSLSGIETVADTLEELKIDSNDFHHDDNNPRPPIPTEVFHLFNLEHISMNKNNFGGPIPDDIEKLTQLSYFSASENKLTGTLPNVLVKLNKLSTFDLRSNELRGALPSVFNDMEQLSVLDLSRQRTNDNLGFTGPLLDFAKLHHLRRLDLSTNGISGIIPENFLEQVRSDDDVFEYVDLSSNYLDGILPAIFTSFHDNAFVKDNMISAINPDVCLIVEQDEELREFKCDAILCKPGTYNSLGRQRSFDNPCLPCDVEGGARYYGSIKCVAGGSGGGSGSGGDGGSGGGGGELPVPEILTTKDILIKLYNECEGDEWVDNTNWKGEESICTWAGISCGGGESSGAAGLSSEVGAGDVTMISMRSNGLIGVIPTELWTIPTLQELILDGNSVDIDFDEVTRVSTTLTSLDLTHTSLNSVNGLQRVAPALEELYLTSNELRGPFPSEIFELVNLKRLSLSFNSLTGVIPVGIGQTLKELKFLSLHSNQFEGPIPESIGELDDLQFLLLHGNNLSGIIPKSLDTLEDLEIVDLSDQIDFGRKGLTGRVPLFTAATKLQRLDLSQNSLTGIVPLDFLENVDPNEFEYVDLSSNQLFGEVPGVMAKFDVQSMDFSDNRFDAIDATLCHEKEGGLVGKYGCDAVLCAPGTYNSEGRRRDQLPCDSCASALYYGTVICSDGTPSTPAPTMAPPSPPSPTSMARERQILEQFYDDCGGPRWSRSDNWKDDSVSICEWFGITCIPNGVQSVAQIMMGANKVSGTPPKELFDLPNLKTLVLDTNDIFFSFANIENAMRLFTLDLSSTGLFSVEGIEKVPNLRELDISSNDFKGQIPMELFEMKSLEQLTLDHNSFSGAIPAEIGKVPDLKLFSCTTNKLSGPLPTELGDLDQLITLRLQKNSLTGRIPDELQNMESLMFVDISHQRNDGGTGLRGSLPSFKNQKNLRLLDLSFNSLTGKVPDDFLANTNPSFFEFADLSSNQITGELPPVLARLDNVFLEDNLITGIHPSVCDPSRGSIYQAYGCNAVLCPPKKYNPLGRQESDSNECVACETAVYFGMTSCGANGGGGSGGGTGQVPTPAPPPDIIPIDSIFERQALMKFYTTCGGYAWNKDTNWGNQEVSICNWFGIRCADGKGETVESINLGSNNIIGTPPRELFGLQNLKSLSLYSNPLNGFNFDGIEKATNLKELLLDATGIQSINGIDKATNLEIVNLRFNRISGTFPEEFSRLKKLKSLTLSYNAFGGLLPYFIQDLTNLETLILSNNNFQGPLEGVTFPPSIQIIDLSNNDLSGTIPRNFLDGVPTDTLLDLDLSDNVFQGTVPAFLSKFDDMNLLLRNNFISEIDEELCKKEKWNGGDVGRYGCNGLLCPPNRYSKDGRQSSSRTNCQWCPDAPFYGATVCASLKSNSATSHFSLSLSVWVTLISATLGLLLTANHSFLWR